jgi:flagellar basal-body rod modification protein FlgD
MGNNATIFATLGTAIPGTEQSNLSSPLAAIKNNRAAGNGVSSASMQAAATYGKAAAQASSTSASASTSAGAGTITSSDFLTLLVTELKNQDPTSTQDPNAYIDQLVQVNSLQQLISINQELAPPASTTTPEESGQKLSLGDQTQSQNQTSLPV